MGSLRVESRNMGKPDCGNRVRLFAGLIAWLAACPLLPAQPTDTVADTVVVHARVYTVNSEQPWAGAIAIRGEKILAVGNAQEIDAHRGPATKVIDAGGRLVLPGFTDCHNHFLDGSLSLQRVHLDDAKDLQEIQRRVKAFADAHPDQPWVLGRGWQYTAVGPTNLPDRKSLDEVVPDRPVYLESFDGHTWWANTKALQLAGITNKTSNPSGGEFVRDAATGEATGAIKEDAADAVMSYSIPRPSRQEILEAYRAGLKEANRVGLVRVHSPGGVGVALSDLQNVDVLEELRRTGDLTVRMYLAYRVMPPTITPVQFQEIEEARRKYHDEWISAGAVKFFFDGVVESHTAAMFTPYTDDPKLKGDLLWDPGTYQRMVAELDKRGIQIFTHAIGDRAVQLTLDAYENAARKNGTKDRRHRIEHIETITAQDIPRFGKLGVIASFQPLHSYPDDDVMLVWARNAGPERTQRAWAWRSVENSGGVLGFGSDWPIVTLNPWPGVQNALTRQTIEGNPPGGFVPKERISLEDAIRGYTLGAAIAGHREKTEGSLEPGKVADLIVVDRDLFRIEPTEIGKTEVFLTMVGGKVVYQSANWNSVKPERAPERNN
jgi:predicted amidohydrolase YtcJ